MLFYGPPGTGKTSTILAMCRDLYGPELMKMRVLELNASDERGISVIREKVKDFASGSVGAASGGPPFKVIILDEADSLTADAQAALRRTMETHSRVTRFCIICNYVSRIIDPLASRCSKYRFSPLDAASMRSRLEFICEAEGVIATPETISQVVHISGGDMRKAITYLQSASQLFGKTVTAENVVEVAGAVTDKAMAPLLNVCLNGGESSNFDNLRRSAQGLLLNGYSMNGILDKFVDAVTEHNDMPIKVKAAALERIALAEKFLVDGADEELQLIEVAATIQRGMMKISIPADKERSYFT
jgi:replication factor C subunit 2/4